MKRALMTVHGFLTETKDFGRLYDYLDSYDEVLPVEIPGHNGEVDFRLFTVDSTQEVVLSAYDKLRDKYDEVDVVGFSMGGALTTWLCSQRDVHRAVLISPSNKFINALMPFEMIKYYGGFGLEALRSAEGNLSEIHSAVKEAFAPYSENISITYQIAMERTFKYMNAQTFGVFNKLMKLSNKAVTASSPIKTETLVLWGKLDELVPFRSVKFVQKHFVNSKCKIYPDIGHAMLYTNRDYILIKDILEFLTDGRFDKEIPPRS